MDSLCLETLIGDHARELTLPYQLVLNNLWIVLSLQTEPSHPEMCQTVNLSHICAGHGECKLPDNIISKIFELRDNFEYGAYVLRNRPTLKVFPAVLSALSPKKFQREIRLCRAEPHAADSSTSSK